MKKTTNEPTDIQKNLDNRDKTLQGCEHNSYDSEPDPDPMLMFLGIG